jgi:hypothetical protein
MTSRGRKWPQRRCNLRLLARWAAGICHKKAPAWEPVANAQAEPGALAHVFLRDRSTAMLDNELPPRDGLPPRSHNADTPEHASDSTVWMGGVIAVLAVLALLAFGSLRWNTTTADLNTAPGVTTGAAPSSPPKDTR